MEEVSIGVFYNLIKGMNYKTSFMLGESGTIRYNGTKGIFKGSCFAKKVNDKYFVDSFFYKRSISKY